MLTFQPRPYKVSHTIDTALRYVAPVDIGTEPLTDIRYSLRMSYINTVAAKKVLDDMSVLSPVVKDLESVAGIATQLVFMFGSEEYLLPVPGFYLRSLISDLNISLELVSRFDSEPEVKSLATKLLDGIKCS